MYEYSLTDTKHKDGGGGRENDGRDKLRVWSLWNIERTHTHYGT